MKGIILAGGSGTRLRPATLGISKQMIPVYDRPMIYYPLSTLLSMKVREVMVITTPDDMGSVRRLLGDGSDLGASITYAVQERPDGIAQALVIGTEFLGGGPVAMILGDNIFHSGGSIDCLTPLLCSSAASVEEKGGAVVFLKRIADPSRFGVADVRDGRIVGIVEKPRRPPSMMAVTGLYVYDGRAPSIAGSLKPSARGELEITDVNSEYIRMSSVRHAVIDFATWIDCGTPESVFAASDYVRRSRGNGWAVGNPHRNAYVNGWITRADAESLRGRLGDAYVEEVLA